jgi:hypothetical protein
MKDSLLGLFGGRKSPNDYLWISFSFEQHPTEWGRLKSHPLSGLGGWSMILLLWMGISSILTVFFTYSFGYTLEMMNPRLHSTYEEVLYGQQVVAFIVGGLGLLNCFLLFSRKPSFRMSFFWWYLAGPLLVIVSLADVNTSSFFGRELETRAWVWAISSALIHLPALWYVFASKRVSLNCDDMLRYDDPFLKQIENAGVTKTAHSSKPQENNISPSNETDATLKSKGSNKTPGHGSAAKPINLVLCSDEDLYGIAWDELEANTYEKGLWARLYAEHDGNEENTRVAYLNERVSALTDKRRGLVERSKSTDREFLKTLARYPPIPEILSEDVSLKIRRVRLLNCIQHDRFDEFMEYLANGIDPRDHDAYKTLGLVDNFPSALMYAREPSSRENPSRLKFVEPLEAAISLWEKGVLDKEGVHTPRIKAILKSRL